MPHICSNCAPCKAHNLLPTETVCTCDSPTDPYTTLYPREKGILGEKPLSQKELLMRMIDDLEYTQAETETKRFGKRVQDKWVSYKALTEVIRRLADEL